MRNEQMAVGLLVEPEWAQKKQGHKPILDGDDLLAILDWLDENNGLTMKKVIAKLQINSKRKFQQPHSLMCSTN